MDATALLFTGISAAAVLAFVAYVIRTAVRDRLDGNCKR
jgi:hypothetical protein